MLGKVHPLYMIDAYCKTFSSVVVGLLDPVSVVLEQTAFYPAGGGQPNDTGILATKDKVFKVVSVSKREGRIIHTVDANGLAVGDTVTGTIDWERRYALMRMHTASHVLSQVFWQEGVQITGNQLGVEQSRVDYSLESFDRAEMERIVGKASSLLLEGHPITISFMQREEAMKLPGMVKLAGALPPSVDELRIVNINDVDMQADGGTHVKNTNECGTITIVKMENKGKSNRRLYFSLEMP